MKNPENLLISKIFNLYEGLIYPIDKVWESFKSDYKDKISCRSGCSYCCERDLTFFPVEIYYIAYSLKKDESLLNKIKSRQYSINRNCDFLKDRKCLIYHFRPVLCRTFGLPVMYKENKGYLLDICNKNLVGINIEDINLDNVLYMDLLNDKLARINLLFSNIMDIDMSERYKSTKIYDII